MLTKLAAHLKIHIDSGRLSFLPIYFSTRSRLDASDREVARGAQVRARARWAEEGESFTAYFLRLERKRATDRYISALRAGNGSLVADKDGLCTLLPSFYLDLFTAVLCDSSSVLSFFRIFLLFFPSMIVRPARAFSARRSVLLLFRVWLAGRPLTAMASPWNFI